MRERYARRSAAKKTSSYSPLHPYHFYSLQEKQRALLRWIKTCGLVPLESKRLLEIGCGHGSNLLQLMQLGFRPENLVGNELLEDRCRAARHGLPIATQILKGDASELDLKSESFDVVYQSTVFTSILDQCFQQKLAERMWLLAKPGGGVLWYDFTYDNPRNPDVRGVPLKRVKTLFNGGLIYTWRITLAPPVGRRVATWMSALCPLMNLIPFFRTHILCWIEKPADLSAIQTRHAR